MSIVRSVERNAKPQHHPLQIDTAYGICRHVARTAAKNFYYGFMVLPRRKRDALSAVYAFMRHADDICDDPGMTIPERRVKLREWLEGYHRVHDGEPTDDPVFLALRDSQQRFGIPLELLDLLVHGTGMDLEDSPGNRVPTSVQKRDGTWGTHPETSEDEPGRGCDRRTAGGGLPEFYGAIRLLLSRGLGGGSGVHTHLRISRPQRRAAG